MSIRHVGHAVGTSGPETPDYRVDLRTGHHVLVGDEPPSGGGADAGPTPFGLLLSGLAACTSITLRMYAARKGWDLSAMEVDARYDVDDDGAASITRTITVPAALAADQRDRLADIASRTPVTLAIRTPIATTVHVFESG